MLGARARSFDLLLIFFSSQTPADAYQDDLDSGSAGQVSLGRLPPPAASSRLSAMVQGKAFKANPELELTTISLDSLDSLKPDTYPKRPSSRVDHPLLQVKI